MAALDKDRFGTYKAHPAPVKNHFALDDADTVLFMHSLAVVNATKKLEPAANDSAGPIVYVFQHYDANASTLDPGPRPGNAQLAEVWSEVIALLDATGLTADDVGRRVYADDDHTVSVSADEDAETRPYVGTVYDVVSATEAYVHIPGVLRQ